MAKTRSIFQEVSDQPPPAGGAKPGHPPGLIARGTGARGAIRLWLALIFVLVAAMILVGGLTRLTDSGLSITEWKPIHGAIPPLTEADWAEEFAKYQATPEYQLQNKGMDLAAFKVIFWWEWGHRQLGRVVGLVWAIGFVAFWATKRIPNGWTGRLLGLGALGGLQGAIGWWMVSSGLTGTMVDVASYRLATHLGLAFVILGLIAWYVLALSRSEVQLLQARRGREARLYALGTGLMHFTFLQILLGALVAGIDAGRAFPTWPDMNGSFFPADAFYVPDGAGGSLPVWHAFFENPGLVQFMHRMAGYLLLAFGILAFVKSRRSAYGTTRTAFLAVLCVMLLQVALGIVTVLTGAHLHVAITHQLGAVLLWVLVIRARFLSQYPIAGSIREGTQ